MRESRSHTISRVRRTQNEGMPKAGIWLDGLIQANGGYPYLISQVHQLVKNNATSHLVEAQKLLRKGKLSVKLKSLGFDFHETYLQGYMSAGVR